jgi:hypothetical protein
MATRSTTRRSGVAPAGNGGGCVQKSPSPPTPFFYPLSSFPQQPNPKSTPDAPPGDTNEQNTPPNTATPPCTHKSATLRLAQTYSDLSRQLTQSLADGADAAFLDEMEARKHTKRGTLTSKSAQPKQACKAVGIIRVCNIWSCFSPVLPPSSTMDWQSHHMSVCLYPTTGPYHTMPPGMENARSTEKKSGWPKCTPLMVSE